jgi:hypothetical protein
VQRYLVRSSGSLQSIQALAVKEATHSVRRVACRAHAAVGACQETLPFRQRNPECRRDLLRCYTVDLVHEQDFSLARSEHAAPPIGVEGGERIIEPFLCSARSLSPGGAVCSLMLMLLCLMRDQLNSPITRMWP